VPDAARHAEYAGAESSGSGANMCPHCGRLVPLAESGLTSFHYEPTPYVTQGECPGVGQHPRCAESDARPLWNGKPNRRFRG